MNSGIKYTINLNFEEIRLPPFQDILILGKNCPQGRIGLAKSFELMTPNEFELIEIEDDKVEAVFVSRKIMKKIAKEKVISVLSRKVFPFVSEGEILRVSFKVKISFSTIEEEG